LHEKLLHSAHKHITKDMLQKLDAAYKENLPRDKELNFESFEGAGSYGVVVKASDCSKRPDPSSARTFVLKMEFLKPGDESGLQREIKLYKSKHRGDNCPFPLLVPVFASSRGKTIHESIKVVLGDPTTIILTVAMEYLSDWPQRQLKNAAELYSREKRVDDITQGLIIQIIDSLYYLQQHGIAHLDMKICHLFCRFFNRIIVWIDCALFRHVDKTYEPYSRARHGEKIRRSKGSAAVITCPAPVLNDSAALPVLGEEEPGRPGTLVYRVPLPCKTWGDFMKADVYSVGVILLEVIWPFRKEIRSMPGNSDSAWRIMEGNVQALAKKTFADFEQELIGKLDQHSTANSDRGSTAFSDRVSSKRSRKVLASHQRNGRPAQQTSLSLPIPVHHAHGRDILRLIWKCLRPNPADRPPAEQMLFSGFVRNYIPPLKLFEELRDTGVLLPGVRLVSGRMRNPLLLIWIEGRGLQVFTLLNSHACEESTYYGQHSL
jgi:serine/threonine protein kinase